LLIYKRQKGIHTNDKWLKGETGKGFSKFQNARNAAGKILKSARDEKDPIKEKIYRIMAQIVLM
jgi:hypothetical protein